MNMTKQQSLVGLSENMAPGWLEEFQNACEMLKIRYRVVAVGADNWVDQLDRIDAFVWRPVMDDPSVMAEIRTKIPLIEAMGIRCFPNSLMVWLYDDKIRETFFLRRFGYPIPQTYIAFKERDARDFALEARYPMVTKTHAGASASGVMLLRSPEEAAHLIDRIFAKESLWQRVVTKFYYMPRIAKGDFLLARRHRFRNHFIRYAYFQEYLTTENDWRITTLGSDLVSVFIRKNRPDDFRASGSGLWQKICVDQLPQEACDLALEISNRHGFTSMAYDFMKSPKGWVIGEISYAFLLNRVYSDTLFHRTGNTYEAAEAVPVGVMHLKSLLSAKERSLFFGS